VPAGIIGLLVTIIIIVILLRVLGVFKYLSREASMVKGQGLARGDRVPFYDL